jgi:hypothetical protein
MKNNLSLKNLEYSKSNILRGALIYSAGDTIASILLDDFTLYRLIGMMFLGATLYAFEIPNYFQWIVKKTQHLTGNKLTFTKTGLAIAYFNPLWIWRHLLFIKIFSGNFEQIDLDLLFIASLSFLVNIPISFIANYIIQNKVHLRWRFLSSAIFSAIMAIYYALSETLFN